MVKPSQRPNCPNFSSGPCSKRPGWSTEVLKNALVGRSHRSPAGKQRLHEVIDRSRKMLGLPDSYLCGIVPASDTGAVEMAMWSLLGARGVDMVAWESFGQGWITDVQKQLKLSDCRVLTADYGALPDLSKVDCNRDVVFTWNGTTAGVKVPNADWIPDHRQGLTLCDATSAVFAMDLPWSKLDVSLGPGKKSWGVRRPMACWCLAPERWNAWKPIPRPGPCPKFFG